MAVDIFHKPGRHWTAAALAKRNQWWWARAIRMACDADHPQGVYRDMPLAEILQHPTDGRTPQQGDIDMNTTISTNSIKAGTSTISGKLPAECITTKKITADDGLIDRCIEISKAKSSR